MRKILFLFVLSTVLISCKGKTSKTKKHTPIEGDTVALEYTQGFSIVNYDGYKILKVKKPFPGSDEVFTYLLYENHKKIPKNISYNEKIKIPVTKIVVTSTTHIPSLVSLDEVNTLIGFPHLDFISSPEIRKRIDEKKVTEIGENENLNTEILLSLQPDVVIGFTMKSNNKTYDIISRSGIPVVYNGDWNELNPLGKAEWIKFFGAFYDKEKKAAKIFNTIKNNYNSAKKLAQKAPKKPTVLAGAMYKDVWYMPKGDSWGAQFIADANADYLYKNTKGTGSLSLSIESVLDKAKDAEFWISPGGFTSYQEMEESSKHYSQFKAFQNKNIYSYAGVKGETGGVLYYELGPNRPDLVLKDLIHIFHPRLLPDYDNIFFKPLK